jgi:hypothetical protein
MRITHFERPHANEHKRGVQQSYNCEKIMPLKATLYYQFLFPPKIFANVQRVLSFAYPSRAPAMVMGCMTRIKS